MTGRREESDLAWRPPADTSDADFGPAPEKDVSHLEEEAVTDSTRHPDPASSGPHHDPAALSGPHQVGGGQSGPHAVNPNQSGPYSVNPGQSGPHAVNPGQSGPHAVNPGQSGPYSVNPGQSGPHAVNPGQSGPHAVTPGQSGPHPVNPGPYGQPGYGQQYGHPQGQPQPGHPQRGPQAAEQPHDLSSARLLKQAKRAPQSGWRKAVYVASGHLINVGESPADVRRRELIARVNQPLRGCYKIAMLSLKGGVGKTTTTTTLGSTFSSLRGDRVIAVDANPDRGTLSQKIPLETTATVRHLLRDADRIRRYSDIRAYTSQGPSRLEVLASEQDPAVSEAFSEADYRRTVALLEHFYNIVLTDCGTGLMHSAMKGVLDIADSLVIVSSGSVDGARSASATLDWLDAHGYRDLVARSVAVINSVRPKSGSVDLDKLAAHFGSRCRAVCRIPFDPHLEEGAEIELDRLAPETRIALLELAATVADDFPR
ncbi:Proline and alanine rich protein EspI, component of Type VII secretion system ESX-1 [Alloactinosynnema sp. L-07]|uniref:MinD/ParA family ATP-binding protein n=1 Tax=Alloactinosynnema sp. L-07 TaxID=1653480 RepID=UPI00065EFCE6|nr:MinD/ParA family protein [Alloactinosynnema sp. L-07]CRK60185.1 Proline and alanine rich protein EspI, component of Type VII secretion system ESX-1 [Alloactinosynnema sp. L-07]